MFEIVCLCINGDGSTRIGDGGGSDGDGGDDGSSFQHPLYILPCLSTRYISRTRLGKWSVKHALGWGINPVSTKLYLSDLKTPFEPRSKHCLLRF